MRYTSNDNFITRSENVCIASDFCFLVQNEISIGTNLGQTNK